MTAESDNEILDGLFHNADFWIMPPGGTRSRVERDKSARSRRATSIRRRCFVDPTDARNSVGPWR